MNYNFNLSLIENYKSNSQKMFIALIVAIHT